jgi:hypothetical protein
MVAVYRQKDTDGGLGSAAFWGIRGVLSRSPRSTPSASTILQSAVRAAALRIVAFAVPLGAMTGHHFERTGEGRNHV